MKKRLHVCALPHLSVSEKNSACAYTNKVWQFCAMEMSLGHEVFLYGPETPKDELPPCTEFIPTISQSELKEHYGEHPKEKMFPIEWDAKLPLWIKTNCRAIEGILLRKQPKDFVCLIGGNCQKLIADAMPTDVMAVEFGIGYSGVFAKYKCFESYAWMAQHHGRTNQVNQPPIYDVVVPNYYNPAQWQYEPNKENYLLYVGRMIKLKGVELAVAAAKANDMTLLLVGQGVEEVKDGKIVTKDFTIDYPKAVYMGVMSIPEVSRIMGKAKALMVPTQYFGPLEGVNCQSQMVGTACIQVTTGVFQKQLNMGKQASVAEYSKHYIDAVKEVEKLDTKYISERAHRLWSRDVVKYRYEEYFDMLLDLWHPEGWEYLGSNHNVNWLS